MSKIPTPIPLRANWRDPLPEPVFDDFPEDTPKQPFAFAKKDKAP